MRSGLVAHRQHVRQMLARAQKQREVLEDDVHSSAQGLGPIRAADVIRVLQVCMAEPWAVMRLPRARTLLARSKLLVYERLRMRRSESAANDSPLNLYGAHLCAVRRFTDRRALGCVEQRAQSSGHNACLPRERTTS